MHWTNKTAMPAVIFLMLASGCASSSKVELPPVQVVQTCPKPVEIPARLLTPIEPEFLKRLEALLTEFSKSVQMPMGLPATGTRSGN